MTEMPNQCVSCGTTLEPGDRFCGSCGQPVVAARAAPETPQPTQAPSEPAQPAQVQQPAAAAPQPAQPAQVQPPAAVPPQPTQPAQVSSPAAVPPQLAAQERAAEPSSATAGADEPEPDRKPRRGRRRLGCALLVLVVLGGAAAVAAIYGDEILRTFKSGPKPLTPRVTALSFDPAGSLLGAGTDLGDVVIYSAGDGLERTRFRARPEAPRSLGLTLGGRDAIVGYRSGVLALWRISPPSEYGVLSLDSGKAAVGTTGDPIFVSVSTNGRAAATFDAAANAVRFIEIGTGRQWDPVFLKLGGITTAAISADHQFLAIGNDVGNLTVLDLRSRKMVSTFHAFNGRVVAVALSPDGAWLAAAGPQPATTGTVVMYGVLGQQPVYNLATSGPVTTLAYSPDGRRVAAAGEGYVTAWRVDSGQELFTAHP